MFKVKKFTLIELIVVIAILTVLAGIVIPNIKDVKDDAKTAAFSGILKNTQTAVDMYLVKNKSYPSDTQPKIGEPQQLNFSLLVPKYLREKPKQTGYYAWVDVYGSAIFAYADSPTGFKNESGTLSWDEVLDAKEYNIYENINVSGAANLKIKKVLQVSGNETTISGLSPDKEYLISTTDYTGNETPLVNGSYLGIESYGDISSGTQKNPDKINHAPIPTITMNPLPTEIISINKTITWGYTFIDEEGDLIQNVEWEGKQDSYSTEGAYTVRLRVQDSHGTWSDWAEQTFTVISLNGVKDISANNNYTLLLMEDGTVKSFGYNQYGQLGYTTSTNVNSIPKTIPDISGVKAISAGSQHSLLLMNDGTVKSFGFNRYGQLGISTNSGTANSNPTPKTISGLNKVEAISAGYNHSLVLLSDGTVKSFGYNRYGQLGYATNVGMTNPNPTPTVIPDIRGATTISAENSYSLIVLDDKTVKSFGINNYGQLGYSTNVGTTNPNQNPRTISGLTGVIDISGDTYHTLTLLEDGTVKSFGYNRYGQLGYSTNVGTGNPNPNPISIPNLSDVEKVIAGSSFSLLLMKDKTVKSFGWNNYGQLGYDTNLETTNPNVTPTTISDVSNVQNISAGGYHSLILMEDKTVKSFGANEFGQLGYNTNAGSSIPNYIPTLIMLE